MSAFAPLKLSSPMWRSTTESWFASGASQTALFISSCSSLSTTTDATTDDTERELFSSYFDDPYLYYRVDIFALIQSSLRDICALCLVRRSWTPYATRAMRRFALIDTEKVGSEGLRQRTLDRSFARMMNCRMSFFKRLKVDSEDRAFEFQSRQQLEHYRDNKSKKADSEVFQIGALSAILSSAHNLSFLHLKVSFDEKHILKMATQQYRVEVTHMIKNISNILSSSTSLRTLYITLSKASKSDSSKSLSPELEFFALYRSLPHLINLEVLGLSIGASRKMILYCQKCLPCSRLLR